MNDLLDLRALPAPEPMERVLDALDSLADGARLRVLLAREPHPLYGILARTGYRWRSEWQDDGCLVTIARNA
ncbi:hypothetical protein ASD28_22560 [Massilia sp. Root133]|uniref:DUF2249 domain-containing protein n=1 Tax=Massilia cellulosiltytica TaxID=2683234 RepID=A0A7X3FXD0_9BURK|nr:MULTISPECIES: DUF2249 domain-containing protein [Telluria group]KQY16229.1 hypothetical protein ASD28_22560 [Massilia sp. Root133]KQZ46838.1 hypothetical protein ASD92_23460 [Massilia sp. Root1485]MVW59711.1 DUF2249 domain-containing protein [Telluria cellulosilytica]